MKAATRPGPRERLLSAARELTYTQGVTVGVEAILRKADVARQSLYQYFGSKERLIAEVLRLSAEADEQQYREIMAARGDDPRERLLALFDALEATTTSADFHGCRYTAADLGFSDPAHPGRVETRIYREHLNQLFKDELVRLGHPDPVLAAQTLALLVNGVLVAAVATPEAHPARAARAMAEQLLDARPA
jgi:AcrR family transcriptional regulator